MQPVIFMYCHFCIGQPLFRVTRKSRMSVPFVWIVRHTVCLTPAPMGAENDKALCHTLKKLLPPLSIIDGCLSDAGQGNVVGCSWRFLLSGSRSTLSWSLPKHWLTAYGAAMTTLLYPPRTPLTRLSCWNTRPFLESEIELVLRRTQWVSQWWTLAQAITS